eukprot:GSChrysophyteH1.ASY1.ANO1.2916.1 assembled CDS
MLTTPWVGPDWEKAAIHADYCKPRRGGKGGKVFEFGSTSTGRHCCLSGIGEQCDIFREKQTSEFGIYGAGVSNYFKFLKWCIGLMLALSLASLPLLLINAFGLTSDTSESSSGLSTLSYFSLGNIMRITSDGASEFSIRIPLCQQLLDFAFLGEFTEERESHRCFLDKGNLGLYFQYIDLFLCFIVVLSYLWLKYFERLEALTLEKNTVFASMYTVQFKNLPPDADEAGVAEYLQKILGPLEKNKVCAVNIAYDNLQEIRDCFERGNCIREKIRLTNQYRYKITKEKEKGYSDSKSKVKELQSEYYRAVRKIDQNIYAREHALSNLSTRVEKPLTAFVTLNTISAVEMAHQLFKPQSVYEWIKSGFKDITPKFRDRRLEINFAPEPSTILWENLPFSNQNRFIRRAFTNTAAFFLIAISVVVTFGAKYLQDTSDAAKGRAGLCPAGFDSLSLAEKETVIENDESLVHCYCDPLEYIERSNDPLCESYFYSTLKAQLIGTSASVVVLMINIGLGSLLERFAQFEKHHTEDERSLNIFQRLFILRYVNTALVFLVNNNRYLLDLFVKMGYIGDYSHEFSSEWYDTIGAQVLLVQIGNIAAGHVMKGYKYFLYHRQLYQAKNIPLYATTQGELNVLHEGQAFRFAENYAQYMSTFFVIMTFNLGMPLLNFVGFVNFFIAYIVDKSFFINIAKSPARLTTKLGCLVRSWIPWAIVLHLLMSVWMLSSVDVFDTPNDEAAVMDGTLFSPVNVIIDKISTLLLQRDTYLLVLVVVFGLCIRVGFVIAVTFGRSGLSLYTSWCKLRWKENIDHVTPKESIARSIAYPRSVQRNLIKGLATYNILHNPVYKESFAISWKFAMSHRRVRSVHMGRNLMNPANASANQKFSNDDLAKSANQKLWTFLRDKEIDEDAKKVERLRRASAIPAMVAAQGAVQPLKATATQERVLAQKLKGRGKAMTLFEDHTTRRV